MNPIPLGFHVICTTYGFWLPNDERGSGSDYVRAPHLAKFGPPTKVHTRQSCAYRPFDRQIRPTARESLRYPYVEFTRDQIACVGRGFGDEVGQYGGTILACAVMKDHFHHVVGSHRYDIRRFAGRLKGAATKRLLAEGLHPLAGYRMTDGTHPSPWGRLPWVVYLWTVEDVRRAIDYVEQNPVKARMGRQQWDFVVAFRG
jgi:REP element-mobilizing transposase RayT